MSESNPPETTDAQGIQTHDSDAFGITSAASGKVDTKDLNVADESHPLAQETGQTGSIKRDIDSEAVHDYLADQIYDSNSAFVREFLQNSETACINAARILLRNHPDYGDDWLTVGKWVDAETGETIASSEGSSRQSILADYDVADEDLRHIEVPRSLSEIVEAARDIGYDPTIEIEVHRDERKIVWQDNGIGMTATEADKAYNTTGLSGVRDSGETGGKMGMGALTFKNMTGKDGEMIVYTGTRRPDAAGHNAEPFCFAAYLGGMDPIPNDVPSDFRGTRFEIPVQESVNLGNFQTWVETYSQMLRVPVLYKEHRDGRTTTEEEFGGVTLTERYNDPMIQIHRPGEFSVVAGPEVRSGYNSGPDTYLVSMKIDRNVSYRVNSLWNAVVQIHDEQGKIVSGPHRGMYRDEIDDLHEDDVITPEPTADRDRLQKDSHAKDFFKYLSSIVKDRELSTVSEIAQEMKDGDSPWEAIKGDTDRWTIFRKMIDYHGPYNVLDRQSRFESYIADEDAFPDYDDSTLDQIYTLFREVEKAEKKYNGDFSAKKKHRKERYIGEILSEYDPERVFMAASTSGAFTERAKVVDNTFDDYAVIVIDGATRYDTYQSRYGFRLLKDVPRTKSDEHDFDVPDKVHSANQSSSSSTRSSNEADSIEEKRLKIRTDDRNQSIDERLSIRRVRDILGNGGTIGGHNHLVLFGRGNGENISDHYNVQEYAAIASATNDEIEALEDVPNVMTFEEYKEWSQSTAIATEDGAMTPQELYDDDRLAVIVYADDRDRKRLLEETDKMERLRRRVANDVKNQIYWGSDDPSDTLLAVADDKTLQRAGYGFKTVTISIEREEIIGLRLSLDRFRGAAPFSWKRLDGDLAEYTQMARTPEWDNDSDVYDLMPDERGGVIESLLFGLHDAGVDPTEVSEDLLQDAMEQGARTVIDDANGI